MPQNGFNINFMILIIYAGLLIMLGLRIVKGIKAKKNLEGQTEAFSKRITKMEYILIAMLVVVGIFNFFQARAIKENDYSIIVGVVMLIIAIFFITTAKSKIYVNENGILADGNFTNYKELKRWGFDKSTGDLVLLKKAKQQKEEQLVIKTRIEDVTAINNLIRKYKLGK